MIDSISQSFSDRHSRHAMLVHFPIVLGALGLVPVLVLAIRKFRSPIGSTVCVAWFASAMIGLGLAAGSGEEAYERVERSQPPLTEVEHEALETHESLGEGAWLWALPAFALSAITLVPRKPLQIGAGVVLIIAAGVLAGFVSITGHTGGALVYDYGLGVPQRSLPSTIAPDVEIRPEHEQHEQHEHHDEG